MIYLIKKFNLFHNYCLRGLKIKLNYLNKKYFKKINKNSNNSFQIIIYKYLIKKIN